MPDLSIFTSFVFSGFTRIHTKLTEPVTGKIKSRIILLFEGLISKRKTKLKPGQEAPDFILQDQNGEFFKLSSHKGKKVVLYFYPKDNTMGCTLQSCNLRDHHAELKMLGYEIAGISNDTVESHSKFIQDYRLPFRLLADTEHKVVKLYDVYGEKIFLGMRFSGIIRTTFVIGATGIIEKIVTNIDTANHTAQILQ